ncbi:MAG: pyrimidine reductase family protein [Actinobacteria bacterium]|nr:pyrimidine reductase family protein [Actinomycetota bacterium]
MDVELDRLWPRPAPRLSDEEILDAIDGRCLRMNFVSSIDGAVTRDGRSGGLSGEADKRFFGLLRRWADVVLVAGGTVRTEGYADMRVDDESARWRTAHGHTAHPVFAIVTGSLNLDPASAIFTGAPERPILITTEQAAARHGHRFAGLADVCTAAGAEVDGSGAQVDGSAIAAALRSRGLERTLCEGGPALFGALLQADVVDELCLTMEPTLEAGGAGRIARGATGSRSMRLMSVLQSEDTLLLRYARARESCTS